MHRELTPAFDWAAPPQAVAPSLLVALHGQAFSRLQATRLQSQSIALSPERRFTLQLGEVFESHPGAQALAGSEGLVSSARSVMTGQIVAAGIDQDLGGNSQLSLGAVLARQRFASAGLGLLDWNAPVRLYGSHVDPLPETATGGGVRIDYSTAIDSRFGITLGVQSKINMEPFKSYRGVYSDPGDFDIPARAEAGLHFAANDSLGLSVGAERVFYADIDAFTSAALPRRFLSLLADGSSPVFQWRDLTVYSAEARLLDHAKGEWSLRYTTRQQPSPTSDLLLRALKPEFTNTNLGLGYRRQVGARGQISLAASYSPSRYFIGATPYVQRDLGNGSQVEVEAVWRLAF